MKTIIFIFLFVFNVLQLFSQDLEIIDLFVDNQSTTRTMTFVAYPVSMVFNGALEYNLHAFFPSANFHFINGAGTGGNHFSVPPGGQVGLNFEGSSSPAGVAAFGKGIYKMEFSWIASQGGDNNSTGGFDTCTIEFDAGIIHDLTLTFRDDQNGIGGNGPRITYRWANCSSQEINIADVNKTLQCWNHCSYPTESGKTLGNFVYDNSHNNNYSIMPQDFRWDCGDENQDWEIVTNRTGLLTLNLTIDKNVETRTFNNTQKRNT